MEWMMKSRVNGNFHVNGVTIPWELTAARLDPLPAPRAAWHAQARAPRGRRAAGSADLAPWSSHSRGEKFTSGKLT